MSEYVVKSEPCDSHTMSKFGKPSQAIREARCRTFFGSPSLGCDGWNRCEGCLRNGERLVVSTAIPVEERKHFSDGAWGYGYVTAFVPVDPKGDR